MIATLSHGFSKFLKIFYGWPPRPLDPSRETAWLDGVRGVAAFLVVMNHYNMEWLSAFAEAPFGARVVADKNFHDVHYHFEGDRLWEPWRLPFLRVFMTSGNAQVAVFFVLSGFVLSWSPLATARAGNTDKLVQSLGGSVIRRWFRLFLPCFAVSFLVTIPNLIIPGLPGNTSAQLGFWGKIWEFITVTEGWANPFFNDHAASLFTVNKYNYVMWTIPFEFAGSIFVYVSVLGLSRFKDFRRRAIATVLVSLYACGSGIWGYWLFGCGLALADYIRHVGGFKALSQKTSTLSCCAWSAALAVGLLLMGFPPPNPDVFTVPGYAWMQYIPLPPIYRSIIVEGRIWWGIGGIMVVTSSCHLRHVRRFFELSFNQFLGRISFMLYLIHFPVNRLLSRPLKRNIYSAFCSREHIDAFDAEVYKTNAFTNIGIYCLLMMISLPIAMSLSHLLEVWVDRPCTNFGKWLDDKLVNGFWGKPSSKRVLPIVEEEEELLSSTIELGEVVHKHSTEMQHSESSSTAIDIHNDT